MHIESRESIQAKNIILEIGTGVFPFPATGLRRIQGNEVYIGIDKYRDPRARKIALDHVAEVLGEYDQQQIRLENRNGEDLSFLGDDSVGEVIICNVFGYLAAEKSLPGIIQEAQRVLRPNGIMTVVETITPVSPWTSPERSFKFVKENSSFKRRQLDDNDPNDKISSYYNRRLDPQSYILRFQKLASTSNKEKLGSWLRGRFTF